MRYNESEFIQALGVVPKDGADGHGIERLFECAHGGLKLLVSVFQYDCDMTVSICQEGMQHPIISKSVRDFMLAECIRDPRGDECLQIVYRVRASAEKTSLRERMRVYVAPQIRMTLEYDFD